MSRSIVGYASPLAILLFCMGYGCVVGPLPEPATYTGGFDLESISLTSHGEQTAVTGGPGAVEEGVEVVTVDNLDRRVDWARVEVAADRSFAVELDGSPDEVFRLHGAPRGAIDVTSEEPNGGAVVPPEHHQNCLVPQSLLSYHLEVEFGAIAEADSTTFVLYNWCEDPVVLLDGALHHGDGGFEVHTDLLGTQIDPYKTGELDVSVECNTPGERRDLYVFNTDCGRGVVSLSALCRE